MKIPLNKLTEENATDASMLDTPFYILELRNEIKALLAEVELLKPSKHRCTKCNDTGLSENTLRRMDGQTRKVLCPCECTE